MAARLDALGNRIPPAERRKIEAALASKVPPVTAEEVTAFDLAHTAKNKADWPQFGEWRGAYLRWPKGQDGVPPRPPPFDRDKTADERAAAIESVVALIAEVKKGSALNCTHPLRPACEPARQETTLQALFDLPRRFWRVMPVLGLPGGCLWELREPRGLRAAKRLGEQGAKGCQEGINSMPPGEGQGHEWRTSVVPVRFLARPLGFPGGRAFFHGPNDAFASLRPVRAALRS